MITGGNVGLNLLFGKSSGYPGDVPLARPFVSWPRINGVARSGEVLTIEASALTNVQSYQWYLEGELVPGATSASFVAPMMGNVSCHVVADQGAFVTPIAQVTHSHVMDTLTHIMMEDAVLALARHVSASHIAVQDGSWNDPLTWDVGAVPGEGAVVLVPIGVNVTYDVSTAPRLDRLRLDGALRAALDQSCQMHVETVIIAHSGLLEIGAGFESRLPGVFEFELTLSDRAYAISQNAPSDLDLANDPFLMSRGIICLGNFVVFGDERKRHIKTANGSAPLAGDTSIQLAHEPVDWSVGDEIVIPGTAVEVIDGATTIFDERRVITDIFGPMVSFADPLVFDHDHRNAAVTRTDLQPSIANVKTNVVVRSEATTVPHRRGHIMVMHDGFSDVWDLGCLELGRSDKTASVGNVVGDGTFEFFDEKTRDITYAAVTSQSNSAGRYPFHFHMCNFSRTEVPSLHNSVVDGSPGWGVVHHGCEARIFDNVVFNWAGSGMVGESGDEVGPWVRNLVFGCRNTATASYTPVKIVENPRGLKGDFGRFGVAYYMRGRAIRTVDNIAASSPTGYALFHRQWPGGENITPLVNLDRTTTDVKDINPIKFGEVSEIPVRNHTISHFTRNEAYGCYHGINVSKVQQKQGHDIMSQLDDFRAWGVVAAMGIEYVANYIVSGADLVSSAFAGDGYNYPVFSQGISFVPNSAQMTATESTVEGFTSGVLVEGSQDPNNPGIDNDSFTATDPRFIIDRITYINCTNELVMTQDSPGTQTKLTSEVTRVFTNASPPTIVAEPTVSLPFIISEWTGQLGNDLDDYINVQSGLKVDSVGNDGAIPKGWDRLSIARDFFQGSACYEYGQVHGYWTFRGKNILVFWQYYTDRITARPIRMAHAVEMLGTSQDWTSFFTNNGEWVNSANPPTASDFTIAATANTETTIDVLALSGAAGADAGTILGLADTIWGPTYFAPDSGDVIVDPIAGTVKYKPDFGFAGSDEMYVWVTDNVGNYVTVRIDFTVV